MLEQQERARQEAMEKMLERTNVIGDIATRDKAAAERRRIEEEASLVREAQEAAARAKEMEEAERKEVCVCVCVCLCVCVYDRS